MIKICTTIEQSKKLIELGINVNTADMYWLNRHIDLTENKYEMFVVDRSNKHIDFFNSYAVAVEKDEIIPAWSLAALLDVLPTYIKHYIYDTRTYKNYHLNLYKAYYCNVSYTFGPSTNENDDTLYCFGRDNFVDACVAMIGKLYEQKLL